MVKGMYDEIWCTSSIVVFISFLGELWCTASIVVFIFFLDKKKVGKDHITVSILIIINFFVTMHQRCLIVKYLNFSMESLIVYTSSGFIQNT